MWCLSQLLPHKCRTNQPPSSHSGPCSSTTFPPGLQSSQKEKPSFPATGVLVLTQLRLPQCSLLEEPWSYQTSVIARVALPRAPEARSKGSTTFVPHEQFCHVWGMPQKHSSELRARVLAMRGGENKGGADPLCFLQMLSRRQHSPVHSKEPVQPLLSGKPCPLTFLLSSPCTRSQWG